MILRSKDLSPLAKRVIAVGIFMASACGRTPDGLFHSSRPFVTSDGTVIVAAVRTRGSGILYAFPRTGGQGRVLVSDGDVAFPSGEPNGSRIAYTNHGDGSRGQIAIVRPGGPRQMVTELTSFDAFPQWSKDGALVYFARPAQINHPPPVVGMTRSRWEVHELSLPAGTTRVLTREGFQDLNELTACGHKLVVSGIRYQDPHERNYLYLVDAVTGAVTVLGTQDRSSPAFFPSCDRLVYVARVGDGPGAYIYELFVLSLADNRVQQLTTSGSYLASPSVSPDGKSVIFLSDPERDGSYELWEVGTEGDSAHRIDIKF